VEKFLVTTALEETWGNGDEHLIFLGERFRVYYRKDIWNQRSNKVLPYHCADRDKFANDQNFLEQLKKHKW